MMLLFDFTHDDSTPHKSKDAQRNEFLFILPPTKKHYILNLAKSKAPESIFTVRLSGKRANAPENSRGAPLLAGGQ